MTIKPVSFIVLTKNNASTISNCIESICMQKYPDFDIYVIDANSSDGTNDIVIELMKDFDNIKLYDCGDLSIGAARQFGLNKTVNEFIAFVDSDCELPDDKWLDKMMEYFTGESIACVWTMGNYKKSYPSIARYTIMSDANTNKNMPLVVDAKNYMPIGMGHTIIRKSKVNEVGGFMDMSAAEDIDVTKKLVNAGYSLAFCNQLVYHLHATSYNNYMAKYKRNILITLADTKTGETKPNYVKFIIDNTIMPIITCANGLISDKDSAWLWHPIICYSKCFTIVKAFVK